MQKKKREIVYINSGTLSVGLDEAGRGCLAGPVVAAAVAFPEDLDIVGLADSKVLKAKERLELAAEIKNFSLAWGVGLASVKFIYDYDILQASLMAMLRAYIAMERKSELQPKILLIDGTQSIPQIFFKKYQIPVLEQKTIIDGDALVPVISAASILAKTFRDELMVKYDKLYPDYNFSEHKGYGTKDHLAAIEKFGPCPIHRMKFKPLRINNFHQTSLLA